MNFVVSLRELWLRRSVVAVGLAISVMAGLLFAYRISLAPPKLESRQYSVGLANARVLVDTPQSKVVDLDAQGADFPTLGGRAALLANLMASGPVKVAIARRAGVSPQAFTAVPSSPDGTAQPTPTPANDQHGSVLSIQTEVAVPIITVAAQAPTAAQAARLANGAVAGLRDYLGSVAAAQKVPASRKLIVTQLGPALASTSARGPRKAYAVVLALFVFLALSGAVLGLSAVARQWRALAADEREANPAPPAPSAEPATGKAKSKRKLAA